MMQQISAMLNSNENFQINDTFSVNISHIRNPGTGGRNRRIRKGELAIKKILDIKKCVVKIKNQDELCCARAILTMIAHADHGSKHSDYINLRKSLLIQEKKGRALHQLANIPLITSGLPKIQKLQDILPDHILIILSVDQNYRIIYKGSYEPYRKEVILIKVGEHYHACTSLKAFMGRNHFCLRCEKGFDHDNMRSHTCNGRKCGSCFQTECEEYHKVQKGDRATYKCGRCQRKVFGTHCLSNHTKFSEENGKEANNKRKSVCSSKRKCSKCMQLLRPREINSNHVCGTNECPSCREYKNLNHHQCFIQNPTNLEKQL